MDSSLQIPVRDLSGFEVRGSSLQWKQNGDDMSRPIKAFAPFRRIWILCATVALFLSACDSICPATANRGKPADLPLPSSLPLQDYERVLYRFLLERCYAGLEWPHDKSVRDTGPYIENQYYGTHPSVRIYYSPEVMRWLKDGRKGDLPDGSMIIKEMFLPPAVLYQELGSDPKYEDPESYQRILAGLISAWTVMVRDSTAFNDGWFWAGPAAPEPPMSGYRPPTVSTPQSTT